MRLLRRYAPRNDGAGDAPRNDGVSGVPCDYEVGGVPLNDDGAALFAMTIELG